MARAIIHIDGLTNEQADEVEQVIADHLKAKWQIPTTEILTEDIEYDEDEEYGDSN